MKHKPFSFTGFAITVLTITLLIITHACSIEERPEIETTESNPHNVTVEEAMSNLNSALELINGGGTKATIGGKVSSVKLITAADFPSTKALDGQDEFEQLLYVVDFEDNQGYAVLGADDRFVPVLVITEQGSAPQKIVAPPSANPGDRPTEGLTIEQLYCEEDGDYYLGSDSLILSTLISDYLTKTMAKIINPPGADTGGGNGNGEDPTNPGDNPPAGGTTYTNIPAMLNTKWHQYAPFNDKVSKTDMNGNRRPIGCTTIAAIQILAYDQDISLSGKFGISNSTWDEIENCETGITSNPLLNNDISALAQKAADGIGVKYNFLFSGGTFATPAAVTKYLKSIGYTKAKKHLGYSLSKITEMLKFNRPVFIGALSSKISGHAWVIDGIHEQYNSKYPASKQTLLHCNWGWSGESENGNIYYGVLNGYYESELFDTTKGPEMLDDKDTHVSASNDLRGWWCYRFITY